MALVSITRGLFTVAAAVGAANVEGLGTLPSNTSFTGGSSPAGAAVSPPPPLVERFPTDEGGGGAAALESTAVPATSSEARRGGADATVARDASPDDSDVAAVDPSHVAAAVGTLVDATASPTFVSLLLVGAVTAAVGGDKMGAAGVPSTGALPASAASVPPLVAAAGRETQAAVAGANDPSTTFVGGGDVDLPAVGTVVVGDVPRGGVGTLGGVPLLGVAARAGVVGGVLPLPPRSGCARLCPPDPVDAAVTVADAAAGSFGFEWSSSM